MPQHTALLADYASKGGEWTAREIAQQPAVWAETQASVVALSQAARGFLAPLLVRPDLRIILTGAGSSAYIGQCLLPEFLGALGRRVETLATTDLVASPAQYFQRDVPTLLVSFARSGSSPESLAAVDLADRFVADCHHLVVTCNADGELRRRLEGRPNGFVVLLPPATHDRGFAMTSSFSSMLHAARVLLVPGVAADAASRLGRATSLLLEREVSRIEAIAQRRHARTVYLGSGGLGGLANEAALKLLELSDGAIAALANTSLGFRHGPKTFVTPGTLVVQFASNDPLARRYDLDLVRELCSDGIAARVLVLSAQPVAIAGCDVVNVPGLEAATDAELALPYVAWAQLYAFHCSLALGCRPDSPSAAGVVNRVVQGVTIYAAEG